MENKDYWSTVVEGNKLYQMGPQSHRTYALKLLAKKGVRSLLDVGCGTAPIYEILMNAPLQKYLPISEYKGVDPSADMIEVCKSYFPEGNFEQQNAILLREEAASWDALLYMHSFDYIYFYKTAIEEMYRVAKNYVCLIFWQSLNPMYHADHKLNNSINGIEEVDWDTARLQYFAWPKLKDELKEVGFKVIFYEDGEIINKEGHHNTLILLEK
ncbi:MAG: methyltransferase domain-containing protein [Rhabdochlamydiaceae bacterium]